LIKVNVVDTVWECECDSERLSQLSLKSR